MSSNQLVCQFKVQCANTDENKISWVDMLTAFVFMNQLFLNNRPFVTDKHEGRGGVTCLHVMYIVYNVFIFVI